ncbi:2109_t:CDS:2 [Rhizophagus irregularis]|nr:2109_t:CDS:2 [Rhizophagus irregularis]
MTSNGKAIFEFTFPDDALNDDHPVFSPPFATSNDTFWQLKFYKADPDNRACSVLYLIAIPNHEEALTTNIWEKRAKLSVMLYIKSEQYEKFNPIKTDKYSVRSYSWGVNFPLLKNNQTVNVGIIFSDTTIERNQVNSEIIFSDQVSKELMSTWMGQINNMENANIQLNFNDGFILTHKSVLIKRSEYFPDYYLIPDLRQKARIEIYKRLHFDNVVKVLFSEGYKWKDLKDDMVDYIVSHFDRIKDTPEYKLLAVDNRSHPAIVVLMQEIIANLFYKKSTK